MLIPKAKIEKNEGYTFPVGKIRVWEGRLLHPSTFYQLADAKSLQEVDLVLGTTSYAKNISLTHFDKSLEKEEITTLNLIKGSCKDYTFLLPFFYKRDIHNLKLLSKSRYVEIEDSWIIQGLIEKEIILTSIKNDDISLLPRTYQGLIKEARRFYEGLKKLQMIDIFLDKKLYEEIFHLTRNLPFINQFFRREVDLLNIKNFIRCRRIHWEEKLFASILIKGGLIEDSFFQEIYREPKERLSNKLIFTPYTILSSEGIPYLEKTGKFHRIEQNGYSILLQFLSPAKYVAFGYEPLLRYLFLKMNEVRNLRVVFSSKLNGVKPENIKERLGPFQ